jgi:hypothetical protein
MTIESGRVVVVNSAQATDVHYYDDGTGVRCV